MEFEIVAAEKEDLSHLIDLLNQLELDSRNILLHEFILAKKQNQIIGFIRLKKHSECYELCSLGVVEPERYKYVATKLVNALLKKNKQPLYLVCIIPEFFKRFNFNIVTKFPQEMNDKLEYCINSLPVEEQYVAMKLN
ncbi:MAG: GNAT family N-acetyltransferase [Bacteroidia bacterium]